MVSEPSDTTLLRQKAAIHQPCWNMVTQASWTDKEAMADHFQKDIN